MHRRAVLILLALLVVPSPAWAGDVAGAMRFVPSDAFAVVGAHGERVRRSPHYPALLDMLLDGKQAEVEALEKQTGFDVRRDVRALIVALRSKRQGGEESVMVAEARIQEAKLVAFLRKQGKKVEAGRGPGGTVYRMGNDALAIRGGFVVAGDEPAVLAALSAQGPAPELALLVAGVQQRDVFFAARPTAEQRRELARRKPELAEARSLRGGADVGASIRGDATLEMASPAAAKRLHRQAQAALAVARLSGQTGIAGDLLNAVTIESSGRELRALLRLSEAQIRSMLQLF